MSARTTATVGAVTYAGRARSGAPRPTSRGVRCRTMRWASAGDGTKAFAMTSTTCTASPPASFLTTAAMMNDGGRTLAAAMVDPYGCSHCPSPSSFASIAAIDAGAPAIDAMLAPPSEAPGASMASWTRAPAAPARAIADAVTEVKNDVHITTATVLDCLTTCRADSSLTSRGMQC